MDAQPIERELTEDEYEEILNKICGEVYVCGLTFDSGAVLRKLDPIAFRCSQADYESELESEEWKCGCCGVVYDDEDDAEECCRKEEIE